MFQKLCQNINKKESYISVIFWAFKSKLQITHAVTYIALFLPNSNNCFFLRLVPYIHTCLYYFQILCFCFHCLFHAFFAMRHIPQFTMLDSISLQPARNITEIKILHSPLRKKKCRVNYNQPNALIFSWYKV